VPQLTINPSLLVIQPLTPLSTPESGPDLSLWAEHVHNEHMRDRGHLRELIGAVKQKEFSQDKINKAAQDAAKVRRDAIKEINAAKVEVRKPLLKRLF